MSVESLSGRRNQRDRDRLVSAVSSASVTSLQQWQHMRDASAEASAWNDLQALARGYGYTWSVQQDLSGRLIGELWAGPRRYARVSAPSRVVAVEMLVAWLEANQ